MKLYVVVDSEPDYDGSHDNVIGIYNTSRPAIIALFTASGEKSYIQVVNLNEPIDLVEGSAFITKQFIEDKIAESAQYLESI